MNHLFKPWIILHLTVRGIYRSSFAWHISLFQKYTNQAGSDSNVTLAALNVHPSVITTMKSDLLFPL